MKNLFKLALVALALNLVYVAGCYAGEFQTTHRTAEVAEVTYEGRVEQGDAKRLRNLVVANIDRKVMLTVNSPGGNAWEGFRMAELIRQHGNVFVKVEGSCKSSCANFSVGAKGVKGILQFHNARLSKKAEERTRLLYGDALIEKELAKANALGHELWRQRLTEEQVQYVLERESRTNLVGVRFKDF